MGIWGFSHWNPRGYGYMEWGWGCNQSPWIHEGFYGDYVRFSGNALNMGQM